MVPLGRPFSCRRFLKPSHGRFSWLSAAGRCPCSTHSPRMMAALSRIDVSLIRSIGALVARPALSRPCDLLRDRWRIAQQMRGVSSIARLIARVYCSTRRGHAHQHILHSSAPPLILHSAGYTWPALVTTHIPPLTLALVCSADCGSRRFRRLDRRAV